MSGWEGEHPVFDDDFIKGAVVKEDDHCTRQKTADQERTAQTRRDREQAKERRRQDRLLGRPRRHRRSRLGRLDTLHVSVVSALVLVLLGLVFLQFGPNRSGVSGSPSSDESRTLRGRNYAVGECVWWDDAKDPDAWATTEVVPCTEPHFVEISGSIDLGGRYDSYPTDADVATLYREDCRPLNDALLGAPLDPAGRYFPTGLLPTPNSWGPDHQTITCGLGVVPERADPAATKVGEPSRLATSEKVDSVRQHRTFDVGTCLVDLTRPIACNRLHLIEITGSFRLGEDQWPLEGVDANGWRLDTRSKCDVIGERYTGMAIEVATRRNIVVAPLDMPAESWDAGARTQLCYVAMSNGFSLANTSESLAGPAGPRGPSDTTNDP